jgi:uncharacterized surface protein with fasciclin (FAS1) repeats
MNARFLTVGAVFATIAIGATACGGSGSTSTSSSKPASSAPASSAPAKAAGMQPMGPACSTVPKSGKGSFAGMAQDPVATAASNNPALSTLVTAVKKAGLVDTLNSAKNITVFAPDNDAFAKIPKKKLDAVLKDKKALTKILTFHVAKGKTTPDQMASGNKLSTLEGGKLTPSKMGDTYEVNGAKVVCGNVPTSNATVYIIDTVMMPKM